MRAACGGYGVGAFIGAHDGAVVEEFEFNKPAVVFPTQLGSGTSPEGTCAFPVWGTPDGAAGGVSLAAGTGDPAGGGTTGAPPVDASALGVARTIRPSDGDAPKATTHEPLRRNNTMAMPTTSSIRATKTRNRFIR